MPLPAPDSVLCRQFQGPNEPDISNSTPKSPPTIILTPALLCPLPFPSSHQGKNYGVATLVRRKMAPLKAFCLKGPRSHCPTCPKLAGSPSHTRTLKLQTGHICEPTWWVSSSEKEPGLNKQTRLRPNAPHRMLRNAYAQQGACAARGARAHTNTLRMLPALGVCRAGWGFPAIESESWNRRVSGGWERGLRTIFFSFQCSLSYASTNCGDR